MSTISLSSIVPQQPPSTTPVSTNAAKFSWKEYTAERRPEVAQLGAALKSGNLAEAEQAYQNLIALGKSQLNQDNPFVKANRAEDFNAIGGALQNGDLAGAQQAFASLESTFTNPPASLSPATTVAGPSRTDVAETSGVNIVA
jgi:hypothetical protein